MPKVDLDSIEQTNRTSYPPPFDQPVKGRWQRRIAKAMDLTELGANHVVLEPGAWSSQRHWHSSEDELVIMLSGTAVLIEEDSETELVAGDVAAWPKGIPNGHHLVNRSTEPCSFIAIGAGPGEGGAYSDIDMLFRPDGFFHRDGTPYDRVG